MNVDYFLCLELNYFLYVELNEENLLVGLNYYYHLFAILDMLKYLSFTFDV